MAANDPSLCPYEFQCYMRHIERSSFNGGECGGGASFVGAVGHFFQ